MNLYAYRYVHTMKSEQIVKTSISKQRGSPRKLTEAHGSSRVSEKTTFLLFLPLENAFFRVKNRRKSGILELSVRARGRSQIVTRQIACKKRY